MTQKGAGFLLFWTAKQIQKATETAKKLENYPWGEEQDYEADPCDLTKYLRNLEKIGNLIASNNHFALGMDIEEIALLCYDSYKQLEEAKNTIYYILDQEEIKTMYQQYCKTTVKFISTLLEWLKKRVETVIKQELAATTQTSQQQQR